MATDNMPYHGIWHNIKTPHGIERIRARIETSKLQELVDHYAETQKHREKAESLGINPRTARTYLGKMGMTDQQGGNGEKTKYTADLTGESLETMYAWGVVHKAVELYTKKDFSTREVGDEIDVPPYTVWSWMDKLNLSRGAALQNKINTAKRLGFASRAALRGEVQRLRKEDCTIEEIAEAIGCSRHLVTNVLDGRFERDPARMREKTRERRERNGKPRYSYKPGGGADYEEIDRRRERVHQMREDGIKPLRIAKKLDVSVATVYLDLQEAA